MPLAKPLTKQLYREDINKMKKEFLKLDLDGDGTITIEEAGNVLRAMRKELKASEREIKEVLRQADINRDGTIDLKEYYETMKKSNDRNLIYRALVRRSQDRKLFEKFDKDGNGYITEDELKLLLEERYCADVSDDLVEQKLNDVDKDSDGRIDYEEFIVMFAE